MREILDTTLCFSPGEGQSPCSDCVPSVAFRHHSKQAGPQRKSLVIMRGTDTSTPFCSQPSPIFLPASLLDDLFCRAACAWALCMCVHSRKGGEKEKKKKDIFPSPFLFQHTGAIISEMMFFCSSTWLLTAGETSSGSPEQPAVPYDLILPLTYSPCHNLCKLCIFNFSCNTWSCVRCSH